MCSPEFSLLFSLGFDVRLRLAAPFRILAMIPPPPPPPLCADDLSVSSLTSVWGLSYLDIADCEVHFWFSYKIQRNSIHGCLEIIIDSTCIEFEPCPGLYR